MTNRAVRASRVVAGAAAAATLLKLYLAWTTQGTNDVSYWTAFAAGVDQSGPIGVYGHQFAAQ